VKHADGSGKQLVDARVLGWKVWKSCRNGDLSQLIAKRRADPRYLLARRRSGQADMKFVAIETRAVAEESLSESLLRDLGPPERSPPRTSLLQTKTKSCVTDRPLRFAEREDPLVWSSVVRCQGLQETSTQLRGAAQVHEQQLSIHRGPNAGTLEMSHHSWREVKVERKLGQPAR